MTLNPSLPWKAGGNEAYRSAMKRNGASLCTCLTLVIRPTARAIPHARTPTSLGVLNKSGLTWSLPPYYLKSPLFFLTFYISISGALSMRSSLFRYSSTSPFILSSHLSPSSPFLSLPHLPLSSLLSPPLLSLSSPLFFVCHPLASFSSPSACIITFLCNSLASPFKVREKSPPPKKIKIKKSGVDISYVWSEVPSDIDVKFQTQMLL